jgi:hypothetical protein
MSGWTGRHSARPDEDVRPAELSERRPRRTRDRLVAIAFALLAGGLGGLALYIILEAL